MTYFADCCVDRMCSEMMLYVEHEHCKSSGSSGFSHFIEKKKALLGVCLLQMLLLSPSSLPFHALLSLCFRAISPSSMSYYPSLVCDPVCCFAFLYVWRDVHNPL